MQEVMSMAQVFAESGMFTDTKQAAQAFVKIQAGQEMGIAPFQAMSGIHIIKGKPTVGAGLMAAMVKGSGKYDYRVLQQTNTVCEIEFFQKFPGKNESLGKSKFTIEQAKKAGTQNLDRFPENMLFARAMSNGVKWYTPDVFNGPIYTPEELGGDYQEPTRDADFEVMESEPTKLQVVPPVEATAKEEVKEVTAAEALAQLQEYSDYTEARAFCYSDPNKHLMTNADFVAGAKALLEGLKPAAKEKEAANG